MDERTNRLTGTPIAVRRGEAEVERRGGGREADLAMHRKMGGGHYQICGVR